MGNKPPLEKETYPESGKQFTVLIFVKVNLMIDAKPGSCSKLRPNSLFVLKV